MLHGDGNLGEGERRADGGRHVVRALHGVAVEPVVLGHQAVEEGVEIVHHVRIGVLLNGERGGGVRHEDGEQSGAHPGALQPGGDLGGDFVQALAAGGDLEAVRGHLHGSVQTGSCLFNRETQRCRDKRREHLGGWGSTAVSLAGVEGAQGEGEDGLEDSSEHLPHQQQADDAETAQRAAAGATTCMKPTDAGERKKPVQMPMWMTMAARITSEKFAPGPASDIQAARRGNRSDQRGSYGALAQPIIQPPVAYVSSGKITMPKGSRRMWGMGSSETCPPWKAVRSPPNCAAHAWEASWHVVESRNTTYHTTPAIRNSVFT